MDQVARKKILADLSTAKSYANKAYKNTESTPVAAEIEDAMKYIERIQHFVRKMEVN